MEGIERALGLSCALHRPLLTRAGCALWAGLNVVCLLVLLQVLSKQTSMKPQTPVIPVAISAEAVRGMNLLAQPQKGSAWARAAGQLGPPGEHHVLPLQVPLPSPE